MLISIDVYPLCWNELMAFIQQLAQQLASDDVAGIKRLPFVPFGPPSLVDACSSRFVASPVTQVLACLLLLLVLREVLVDGNSLRNESYEGLVSLT